MTVHFAARWYYNVSKQQHLAVFSEQLQTKLEVNIADVNLALTWLTLYTCM